MVSEDGGCGCSLLAEDADWEAPAWQLRAEVCDALAGMVLALAERLPGGFTLQALWAGDAAGSVAHVSAAELAERARSNALANFTRYVVQPAPARQRVVAADKGASGSYSGPGSAWAALQLGYGVG